VESISIRLKLFSIAKDLAGFDEKTIELPLGSHADAVLEHLIRQNPLFKNWKPSLRVAVNMVYDDNQRPLSNGDEVAIIPPVSGG
jgi:molybdopterin converting factor subunit 1